MRCSQEKKKRREDSLGKNSEGWMRMRMSMYWGLTGSSAEMEGSQEDGLRKRLLCLHTCVFLHEGEAILLKAVELETNKEGVY